MDSVDTTPHKKVLKSKVTKRQILSAFSYFIETIKGE